MAKSMRSKREKRLRAIRRDLVQPLCDKKDEAKLPVKPSPFASTSSSAAMDTTTTTTTIETQMGMSSIVRFLFFSMICSVFVFYYDTQINPTRNSCSWILELKLNGYVVIVEYWIFIIDVYCMPACNSAVVRGTVFVNFSFRDCWWLAEGYRIERYICKWLLDSSWHKLWLPMMFYSLLAAVKGYNVFLSLIIRSSFRVCTSYSIVHIVWLLI